MKILLSALTAGLLCLNVASAQLAQTGAGRSSPSPNAASGGGGGPWTPASVTTAFWYKSDTQVYKDAGITPAGNGDTVQQWNDLSGNGRNLTQSSSGLRPTFNTGILNGLPGVHFIDSGAGTSGQMVSSSFSVSLPLFIMIVFKTDATAVENFAIIVDDAAQSGNRPIMFLKRTDPPASGNATIWNVQALSAASAVTTNTAYWFYGDWTVAGTSSAVRIRPAAEQTGDAGAGSGFSNGVLVGGNTAQTEISAYVMELFCIPNATSTDKANAIAYVQSRYGL